MEQRPTQAGRLFITAVILAGNVVLGTGLSTWRETDLARLLTYALICVVASRMKIRLPSARGILPAGFAIVFLAIVELSLTGALLLGVVSVVSQSFFPKRSKNYQIVFSVANTCTCISVVYWIHYLLIHKLAFLGTPILFTISAAIFFVLNTFPVAAAIGLTEARPILSGWRTNYFWSAPLYLVGACLAGLVHYTSIALGWQTSLLLLPLIWLVYNSYSSYVGRVEDGKTHADQVSSLHMRTIEALALAIEAKDQSVHAHLRRIQVYAVELAKELNLDHEQVEALRTAAILHDIGKLGVPEHISSKSGKLTPEEFEKMKIHPIVGAEILDRVQFPYPVSPIVLAHHEKWDGTGYPYGLKGDRIPIGARILSIVDCLDALMTEKEYRPAISLEAAMAMIAKESGSSFDPRIVVLLQSRYLSLDALVKESNPCPAEEPSNVGQVAKLRFQFEGGNDRVFVSEEPANIDFLSSIAAARQEAQNLFELSQELGTSLSLSETLSLMASRLKKMVPFDALALFTLQEGELTPEYVEGNHAKLLEQLRIPEGAGISGWVAGNSKPVINGNPALEPGLTPAQDLSFNLRSALAVPLLGVGGTAGVITLYREEAESFSRDHLRILQAIAGKLAFTVENARKYKQAETSASIDYLTGLPNARAIFQRVDAELSRSSRNGETLTVMVCDLDGFKKINDLFGHLTGNSILQVFSANLRELFRQYDLVARLGGDEFVVALPGMNDEDANQRVTEIELMAKAVGKEVTGTDHLSISVGISVYPRDGDTVEGLLSVADRRMYQNKRSNKQDQQVVAPAPQQSS